MRTSIEAYCQAKVVAHPVTRAVPAHDQDGTLDVACVIEALTPHPVLGIIRREALADIASGGISA